MLYLNLILLYTITICTLVGLISFCSLGLPSPLQEHQDIVSLFMEQATIILNRQAPSIGNYWGGEKNVRKHLNRTICPNLVFLHHDMATNGWDSQKLQESVCQDLLVTGGGGKLSNMLVFTHSMGNLVFADAYRKGLCKLDSSSAWISMSAPWKGSKAADYVADKCSNETGLLHWLSEEMNYCNEKTKTLYASWASLKPSYPGLSSNALKELAVDHANASICGEAAFGITSKYSVKLEALSKLVNYGEPNNSMVAISSCMLPKSYAHQWQSLFYLGKINHADGTMRDGNGIENCAKPASWVGYVASKLFV